MFRAQLLFVIVSVFSTIVHAQEYTAYAANDIRESMECVLKITAQLFRSGTDVSSLPLPKLIVDTEANLADFQKDAGPQMGYVPTQVTNVFLPDFNTIYLVSNYTTAKTGRTPYDSLAHEFTHYLQFHIDKTNWNEMTDNDEDQAVRIQTEFRETFSAQIQDGKFVCPK